MNCKLCIYFILATCLSICIRSTEASVISCVNNACDDNEKVLGMKCCKHQNLLSDGFEYNNIQTTVYSGRFLQSTSYSLDIQQFIISNSNISKMPENLFQNINELKYLHVVNSGVRNILVTDFSGANHLINLNLTNNSIKSLEPKLFVHAQNLLSLDLSFNEISHLSEYAFDHLDKLNTLIISNNKLIVFQINQRFIGLEVFRIENNFLNDFGEEVFQNSSKLREINLRNNNLNIHHLILPSNVILDTFDISNNLASISISSKQISIRNTKTSTYFVQRNVEILDASHNQISDIEFESSTHLTKINLSNNNLTSMRNVTYLNNLQQLDLSFNSIKDFAISSFSEMNDLSVLKLKKSGLTSLDFGTFSQQTKLVFLDISDNNLKKINFDTLLFMSSLSVLNIDGNQLTNINVSDLKNILPNLTTISISRNLFKCNDLISIMKTVNLYQINIDATTQNVVKNTSNIRGISCISDSSEILLENNTNDLTTDKGSPSSAIDLREEIDELHLQINLSITESEKEILNLKNSLKSLSIQLENRLNEHIQNLSSFRNEFISSFNTNYSRFSIRESELDSFQFAFMFLIIILILFVCGISLFLFIKFRASARKRRWYQEAKQRSASADQTLV